MNSKTKYSLIIFSAACAAYLAFVLVPDMREQSRRRDFENAKSKELNLRHQREAAAREKLSIAFSKCAADSLTPFYLQEFITHELMPIGIAWKLYNQPAKSKPGDLNKDSFSSPEAYAKERLRYHFKSTLYSEVEVHEAGVQLKLSQWSRAIDEGLKTDLNPAVFDRYPPSFLLKSFSSNQFKSINPEDIELGKKEVDWSKFITLAKRCKATPYDLREMSRDPASSNEQLPGQNSTQSMPEFMEYGAFDQNSEYSQMKQQFWMALSETAAYKKALAEVKADNARIIREFIKLNEPIERKKQLETKVADDAIFKTP